jgi:hypothetical protein
MRLIPVLLMTGLACAQTACAAGPRPLRGPVPLEWRALVGCYRLTQGSSSLYTFALDSTASTSEEGARTARSLRTRPEGGREVREDWRITDRNTVVYMVHEGWGQMMVFVVRGDSLVGRHYMLTDVIGWEPHEPAAAVRVPCPADGSATALRQPWTRGRGSAVNGFGGVAAVLGVLIRGSRH